MGQAKQRGTKEQRIEQSKQRAEQLKKELEILAVEEDNTAKEKEDSVKQLIQWHLKYPSYNTDTQ